MADSPGSLEEQLAAKVARIERARKRAIRLLALSLVLSLATTVLFLWWMVHRARH